MYVDSSVLCNDIAFNLAATVTAATTVTRSWTIKVKKLKIDTHTILGEFSKNQRKCRFQHNILRLHNMIATMPI